MKDVMNTLGKNKTPFLFIIDFDMNAPLVFPISEVNCNDILYDINGNTNASFAESLKGDILIEKYPVSFDTYKTAFEYVVKNQQLGNSYLVNLTLPTEIKLKETLKDIFFLSKARYRLWYKENFVVFSPEPFVRIENKKISSYPMKGTIDAALPNAKDIILENEKERAEHITIVDLIRNDLNIVATDVQVEKFRYVEKIQTTNKDLLQVSSHISGILSEDYCNHIGDILFSLLPAGSVTGAPKKKTVEIIKAAEQYDRGYYTGVFGYFDGYTLESAVMIRFIEKIGNKCYYKSGGGITLYSDPSQEYQELIDKIYVPVS